MPKSYYRRQPKDMVKEFTDAYYYHKDGVSEDMAIRYIKALANKRNYYRDMDALVVGLEEAKVELSDKIYQTFIDIRPQLIQYISDPPQKLCVRAIIADPHLIKSVPQNKFLCRLAMKKNISVYNKIDGEFRTYEYYMQYHKQEQKQKEILSKINTRKPSLSIVNILKPPFIFGVEIEFVSDVPRIELYLLLKKFIDIELDPTNINVDKWALKEENSSDDMCELSSGILDIEDKKDMADLHKVCNVLSVLQKFSRISLNYNYCGLHIHVDARESEYADVIKQVATYSLLQTMLDKLLAPERTVNEFCMPVDDHLIHDNMSNFTKLHNTPYVELREDKFYSVNPYAYFYNDTVEFRQHESTFNFKDIIYWLHTIQSIMYINKPDRHIYFLKPFFSLLRLNQEAKKHYINKYLHTGEMICVT